MGRHLMGAFQFLKSIKYVALHSVTLSYGRGRRCGPNRDDANCQKGNFDSDIHSLLLSSFSHILSLHVYLAIRKILLEETSTFFTSINFTSAAKRVASKFESTITENTRYHHE